MGRSESGGEDLKKRIVVVASAVLVALTLVAIWRFSAQNSGDSSALSGKLAQAVANLPGLSGTVELDVLENILRKIAHGTIYLVLGFGLTGMVIGWSSRLIIWIVPLMGVFLAALDELHQSFVPGRGPSVRDVVIDTVGVCLGMLLVLGLRKCYRRWRK